MIKYSDASNTEKTASSTFRYSLPPETCCIKFIKEASVGNHVCDECGNHLGKIEQKYD